MWSEIASTGAPFYERNPQDGGPIDFLAHPVVATNTLHHEQKRTSHVIAPVVR